MAALIGAVGFELLKLLLERLHAGASPPKSMYGAFGVPIALLLWINFTAKLLLFCAAWTATRRGISRAAGRLSGSSPPPPLPVPIPGLRPQTPAVGLNGLVLRRRTG